MVDGKEESINSVHFLKTNSGKKGEGMPVVRNPQFYFREHFSEMLSDKTFVTVRADEALTTYCDAVAQGFSHPKAEVMTSEVLHRGLQLILENEKKSKLVQTN